MKTFGYYMSHAGRDFFVSPKGFITQSFNRQQGGKFSRKWRVLGFSQHHWQKSFVPFKEAVKNPDTYIKKGIVHDLDYGTRGVWGGSYGGKLPRVQRFSPVTKKSFWMRGY